MKAGNLINRSLASLSSKDTVNNAIDLFENLQVAQLPFVEGNKFKGLICEERVLDIVDPSIQLSEQMAFHPNAYLKENKHFLDLLPVFSEHEVEVVGIVNEELEFQGVVLLNDVSLSMARSFSVKANGAVLILSMNERDFSLAEVCRLVESDGGIKVIYSFIEPDPEDPAKIHLTLKFNKTDITRPIATLERFGYTIFEKFHNSLIIDKDVSNYENLMRFLNI